jgi:2-haloacid dehalogenase
MGNAGLRTCLIVIALVAGIALTAVEATRRRIDVSAPSRFKAVAFDYLVLFNPDSIVSDVEAIVPGRGRELTTLWRTRQFEYSWLRSITGRYVDFDAVTGDALVYAAHTMQVTLTGEQTQRLLKAYRHLSPWPDAIDALRHLRESGVRVITLANFSPATLRSNAESAGMIGLFDALVSTDANHTYKPDPRAYQLGLDRLHLAKNQVVFAAFGGWDAAGAKAFGYPTVWVNRFDQSPEELGVRPDRTVANLDLLLKFVLDTPPPH